MLNIIIEKMRRVNFLEANTQYLDMPEVFEEYEMLSDEIEELLVMNTLSFVDLGGRAKFSAEDLRQQLTHIIELEPVDTGKKYELLTQYEYIERYILNGHRIESKALFNNLFYFMDAESRADWLHANYFMESDIIYADRWANVIIVANGIMH